MKIESSKEKIESLRELINTIIVSENYDADYLVEKSQELDILIVEALKEMEFSKKVFGHDFVKEFDSFLDEIKMVKENYYSIRIVDPVTKEVLKLKEGKLHIIDGYCYEFFEKQNPCKNCISIKAFDNEEIFMKFERVGEKIFLVTAIPILITDKRLSVELFKDISNSKIEF